MSNATAMVRVGGMGWLKPVVIVLLMLDFLFIMFLLQECIQTQKSTSRNLEKGASSPTDFQKLHP